MSEACSLLFKHMRARGTEQARDMSGAHQNMTSWTTPLDTNEASMPTSRRCLLAVAVPFETATTLPAT